MGKDKQPLKDLLSRVAADYNRMCTIKKHRIDTGKRALLYNLSFGLIFIIICFKPFKKLIAANKLEKIYCVTSRLVFEKIPRNQGWGHHRNLLTWFTATTTFIVMNTQDMRNSREWLLFFPNSQWFFINSYCFKFLGPEGLPIETLQMDFWVPNSQARADTVNYAGKSQFQEILAVTEETAILWATRAVQEMWGNGVTHKPNIYIMLQSVPHLPWVQDFMRKASPEASIKAKDYWKTWHGL